MRGVQLNVDDKGALDCILRARLETLLARASGIAAQALGGSPMISAFLCNNVKAPAAVCYTVPGANAAMVSNSFIYLIDALMFDLEDSVALREKDAARRLVYHALQHRFTVTSKLLSA